MIFKALFFIFISSVSFADDPTYLVLDNFANKIISIHHNPLFESFLPPWQSVHRVKKGLKFPDNLPIHETNVDAYLNPENEVVGIAIPEYGIYKLFAEQNCEEAIKKSVYYNRLYSF